MNKIQKSNVFAFILGAIIFCGVGVGAVATLFSYDIWFSPKDTAWKKANGEEILNVEDALNELYVRTNKDILNKFVLKIRSESWSSTDAGVTNFNLVGTPNIINNYKYFKITGVTTSNVKKYQLEGHSVQANKTIALTTNTEYQLSQVDNLWVVVYSNTTGTNGYVISTVELYNK